MVFIKSVYAVDFSNESVNPIAKLDSVTELVNLIVPIMMIAGGLITLSMLLLGAYKYLTSDGNAEKISKAQNIFIYAIIGLALIVASFVITKVIGAVLNVPVPL